MPVYIGLDDESLFAIREIVNVASKAEVLERVNRFLDETDWQKLLLEIPKWEAVKDDFIEIDGDGVKIDNSKTRLAIRNRIRTALGYPELDSSGAVRDETTSGVLFVGNLTIDRRPE